MERTLFDSLLASPPGSSTSRGGLSVGGHSACGQDQSMVIDRPYGSPLVASASVDKQRQVNRCLLRSPRLCHHVPGDAFAGITLYVHRLGVHVDKPSYCMGCFDRDVAVVENRLHHLGLLRTTPRPSRRAPIRPDRGATDSRVDQADRRRWTEQRMKVKSSHASLSQAVAPSRASSRWLWWQHLTPGSSAGFPNSSSQAQIPEACDEQSQRAALGGVVVADREPSKVLTPDHWASLVGRCPAWRQLLSR